MKKLSFLLASLVTLCSVVLLTRPVSTAAHVVDPAPILTETSAAIDEIYVYLDENSEAPDETFFSGFVGVADNTRREVNGAYALLLTHTNESGERLTALQAIRSDLGDMKVQLAEWKESAEAGDGESFNAIFDDFDTTVTSYNDNIDVFNEAEVITKAEKEFNGFLLATAMFGLLAVPVWVIWHRRRYRTDAPAAALRVTPLAFFLWNVVTFGFYLFYWGWKAWQMVAKEERKRYHTVIRAMFVNFTIFTLFRKFHDFAHHLGYRHFRHQLLAACFFGTFVLFAGLSTMVDTMPLYLALCVLQAGILTLIALPVLRAYNYYIAHTKTPLLPLGRFWPVVALTASVIVLAILAFSLVIVTAATR